MSLFHNALSDGAGKVADMAKTDPIRIIPHAGAGTPDVGSFEVRFADGTPSQYFYWDDNKGRRAVTGRMTQDEAREAAKAFARSKSSPG